MGKHEQKLAEYRDLRDAAHEVFQADVELLRIGLTPKALADRAGDRAADLTESMAETARRHRGAVLGGLAAIAVGSGALLWFKREPIGRAIGGMKARLGWGTQGGDDLVKKDDTP